MIRQASLLLAGSVAGQALLLISTIVVARLTSPEAYAQFALFVALTAWANYVCGGRYEAAIAIPRSDTDGLGLAQLSLALNLLAFALLGTAALALLGWRLQAPPAWLAQWPAVPVALAPWMVLASALVLILEGLANRTGRYTLLAGGRFARPAGTAATQLSLVLSGMDPVAALCVGHLAGALAAAVVLAGGQRALVGRLLRPDRPLMGRMAREHVGFPTYNLAHGLEDAAQAPLILVSLTALAGTQASGTYALISRVIGTPLALMGAALSPVLLRRLSVAGDGALRQRTFRRVIAALLGFAVPAALVTIVAAPLVLPWVFGARWEAAGLMAAAMSVYLFGNFVAAPLAVVPLAVGRLRGSMGMGFVSIGLCLVALIATLWLTHDANRAWMLVSLAMALYLPVYLAWLDRCAAAPLASDGGGTRPPVPGDAAA